MAALIAPTLFKDAFSSGDCPPDELTKRWMAVIALLQEDEQKDSQRAGEQLDVHPVVEEDSAFEWRLALRIVGSDSEHVYGQALLRLLNAEGDLNLNANDQLQNYLQTSLFCALNDCALFTEMEKLELLELLWPGTICCDFCERPFAFYADALDHERTCAARPTV